MSEETVIAENKQAKSHQKIKDRKVSFRKQLNFVYL